jgi:hypothetical protein
MNRNALFVYAACFATMFAGAALTAKTGPRAVAHVDLRIAKNPGDAVKTYVPVTSITVPASHKIGNKYFPYEGIGWENELIGYRIYLDERSIADVFGKKTPGVALTSIEQASNYHEMSPWGMDVMHVGPSTGIGGLALYRQGKLQRFGKVGSLKADILSGRGKVAKFRLTHSDVPLDNGAKATVRTTYKISVGSPLTWVSVQSSMPENTLASGLVASPKATFFKSEKAVYGWTYMAQWGIWSENKDELGIALFYRVADVTEMLDESESHPIRFKSNSPHYAFAGVWGKGPQGIDTVQEFEQFLAKTLHQVATMKSKNSN